MGKIKNFKVDLPYECVRDKKWIDENLKPGDVDEYQLFKCEITGEMVFPVELSNLMYRLEMNQKRIEAKIDLLFALLRQRKKENTQYRQDGNSNSSKSTVNENDSRSRWGGCDEEKKLKLYEVMKEAEEKGIALRTTELKDLGGKFSTAVSYSYQIFDGWKDAVRNYRQFKNNF